MIVLIEQLVYVGIVHVVKILQYFPELLLSNRREFDGLEAFGCDSEVLTADHYDVVVWIPTLDELYLLVGDLVLFVYKEDLCPLLTVDS